uniref:SAM domain-containing protein n=1 Tax=Kalanchoe fedtschenkoi TaxID=63787 RepID=A0A7N0U4J0_KALFE
MTKPKVTVTLGHSGHVVRRDHLDGGNDGRLFAGGGRLSIRDRLGSNGASSSYSGAKRMRGVNDGLRPDKQIGKNDLRMKLLRKKRSLQIQRDAEEFRKIDLREKLQRPARPSRTVRIMPPPQSRPIESSIPRRSSPPRSSDPSRFLEPSRRPYSPWGVDELRPRSPERMPRPTRGISPPRISSHMRGVPPLRSVDVSRSGQVRDGDVLLNYRPTPAPLPLRTAAESSQPVRQLPSSSSVIRPSPYVGDEPTTVSGLLQSLGLSKYYINFQAEEVDMPTLRQMGDVDLKEMGIPMGPRKKILLTLKSRSMRRPP